jgi:hypothetical protein
MKRTHRIRIEVDGVSHDHCVEAFEKIVFKLKADGWPELNETKEAAMLRTDVAIAPIAPSVLDRLARIEREIDTRLGGLSEDAA